MIPQPCLARHFVTAAILLTLAGGADGARRFTLLFHRTPAGWRIVHDHTS